MDGYGKVREPEETRKLLEEAFDGAQQSYRGAMERAFALQVVTLEFASRLMETLEEDDRSSEIEERREILNALRMNYKKQRAELQELLRDSERAYTNTLRIVFL